MRSGDLVGTGGDGAIIGAVLTGLAALLTSWAAIVRARKQGTKSGRPSGRPKIDGAVEMAIRAALAKGDKGMRKIAVELGVATGTVQRVAAELKAA